MVDHDCESTKTALAIDMLLYFFGTFKAVHFWLDFETEVSWPLLQQGVKYAEANPALKQAPGESDT